MQDNSLLFMLSFIPSAIFILCCVKNGSIGRVDPGEQVCLYPDSVAVNIPCTAACRRDGNLLGRQHVVQEGCGLESILLTEIRLPSPTLQLAAHQVRTLQELTHLF